MLCMYSWNSTPYFENYSEQRLFFIQSSVRGLWAHFERDSPFISWRNNPAAVMSGCVSIGDLWEYTWDHWEIYCDFYIYDSLILKTKPCYSHSYKHMGG